MILSNVLPVIAATTTAVTIYDNVVSSPDPVTAETPQISTYSEPSAIPEREFSKSAELSLETPQSVAVPVIEKDVIVPAKLTRKARTEYPDRVAAAGRDYSATVEIIYDVNSDGKVINTSVGRVEYEGAARYQSSFEYAAIKAVRNQRFTPRTVNGEPAIEENRRTRIVFKAQ